MVAEIKFKNNYKGLHFAYQTMYSQEGIETRMPLIDWLSRV